MEHKNAFQWYANIDGALFAVETPNYMHDSLDDVLYFITELRLFEKRGFIHQVDAGFLYEGDAVESENVVLVPSSDRLHILRTIDLATDVDVNHRLEIYLQSVAQWKLFEQKITLYGPVSCTAMSTANRNVVILGDVHNNLAVKGTFSHAEVVKLFSAFFGARATVDVSHFKYIVRKMRQASLRDVAPSKHMFVWEFILHLLFAHAHECVDVFLEDSFQASFESAEPTNYLQAVRYMFSICPMVQTEDSPFAYLAEECRELFPNVRCHRIDLRFGVFEDAQGTFVNNDLVAVLKTIMSCLSADSQEAEQNSAKDLQSALMSNHGMDNEKDIEALQSEFMRMRSALRKSSLMLQLPKFIETFVQATLTHAKPTSRANRSKWFWFRTCVTDIYGLSRLFRNTMTPLQTRHKSQLPSALCAQNANSLNAIVYVGDYHAKVWKDVFIEMHAKNTVTVYIHEKKKANRTMVLPEFSRKPFMDTLWKDDPRTVFFHWLKQQKESTVMQYMSLLSPASLRRFYVPFVTQQTRDKQRATFFKAIPQQSALLASKLDHVIQKCSSTNDVLQNEFETMDIDQLSAVYSKKGNCFWAFAMYELWLQNTKRAKSFRDPLSRKIISDSEQTTIINLVNQHKYGADKLERPVRRPNPYQLEMEVEQILQSVNDEEIPFYVVRVRVVMEEVSNGRKVPFDAVTPHTHGTLHQQVFLVCFVHCDDTTVWSQVKDAVWEFLTFVPNVVYDQKSGTIGHKAVHFNNFQDVRKWFLEGTSVVDASRLPQLKNELLPFISFDWVS